MYLMARKQVKDRLGKTASSHSRLLYLSEFFRVIKIAPSASLLLRLEQIYWNTFLLNLNLDQDAKELLTLARSNKIELALVTDLTLQIQLRKLVKLELDQFFDYIVSSEDTGQDKNGENLNQILEKIVGRKRIWFIGDQINDFPTNHKESKYFLIRRLEIPTDSPIQIVSFHEITQILKQVT
jgi:putative hydrolase of the HAD superfamily